MSWLIALLAFAGLMAILSTVTTTAVELIHKTFRMRSDGLRNMLAQVYQQSFEDQTLDGAGNVVISRLSKDAKHFSRQITSPPTRRRRRFLGPVMDLLHILTLGYFRPSFQRLSKLQFIEQLSQTKIGREYAHKSDAELERFLERVGHEFDRAGVAQSAFFRQRSKVLTSLFSIAVVALANINAIEIYSFLATDDAAATRIVQTVAPVEGQELVLDGQGGVGDGAWVVSEAAATQVQLSGLGVPIGRSYFPYCFVESAAAPIDARCVADYQNGAFFERLFSMESSFAEWSDFLFWCVCVLATAGLIGLGAPFWFDAMKSVAAVARARGGGRQQGHNRHETAVPAPSARGQYPVPEPPLSDQMRTLRLTSGVEPVDAASGLVGMRLGDSSSGGGVAEARAPGPDASDLV